MLFRSIKNAQNKLYIDQHTTHLKQYCNTAVSYTHLSFLHSWQYTGLYAFPTSQPASARSQDVYKRQGMDWLIRPFYELTVVLFRCWAVLFSRIKDKTADCVKLRNLWILRDCVRENYSHGIGVDDIIFGENFDGENPDTLASLTKKRFDYLCRRIKELDPYATI